VDDSRVMVKSIAGRWIAAALLACSIAVGLPDAHAQAKPETKAASEEAKAGALTHEIRHQLNVLPFYSVFDNIAFTLRGATLTLTGQVVRPTLKANAEAAVRSLEGVGAIINQIEVLPPSPADDELRNAVYRAIYEDSTLQRYAVHAVPPIHIIVKNGNVTLEGIVEAAADKHVAAVRAGAVANLQSLKDNLVVQTKGSAGE
jgi:hyperosmotically inducible periplasmic protein